MSRRAFSYVLALFFLLAGIPAVAGAAVFNPQSFTLKNGMQVVVITNHRVPVVTHMVWYKIGAMDEPSWLSVRSGTELDVWTTEVVLTGCSGGVGLGLDDDNCVTEVVPGLPAGRRLVAPAGARFLGAPEDAHLGGRPCSRPLRGRRGPA